MQANKFFRIFFFAIGLSARAVSLPVYHEEAAKIFKSENPPKIDAVLDDPAWRQASLFENFKTISPDFGLTPAEKTEVFMTYDPNNLYFAFRCGDQETGKIKASLTNRDNIGTDDWISVELDMFDDSQSNYLFMANPLGIQADGMIFQVENTGGGYGSEDLSFDTVWQCRGRLTPEGYEVELAVPFKSLRFPNKKELVIGVAFRRSIGRKSEVVSFPEFIPKKGPRLAQRQKIMISGIRYERTWETIPAITAKRTSIRPSGKWETAIRETDFSLTGKLGLTPDLILDAAYNPDFSQVESDAGQIDFNLRNAPYYPEKRPFFLEGTDMLDFAANNKDDDRPLTMAINTRNIVAPLLGVKLTGKIGNKDTLSSIFAVDEFPENKADFFILRYKRALHQDSYIGGFLTDKEMSGGYNRIIGTDGRLRLNAANRLEYHLFTSFSLKSGGGESTNGTALGIDYFYFSRKFQFIAGLLDVSKGFNTEIGYLKRAGVLSVPVDARYSIYPKSHFFQRIVFVLDSKYSIDLASKLFEPSNWMSLEIYFPQQTWVYFGGQVSREIFNNHRFNNSSSGAGISTQILKQFNFQANINIGKRIYYDPVNPYQGKGANYSISLAWQPTDQINIGLSAKQAVFYRDSDGEKIYDYAIVRSRNTFQLNKYLFLRGIIEVNAFYKKITADFLASFTYIPGTVIQLGYGSMYEKVFWTEGRTISSDDFQQTNKAFFFKASYMLRL